MRGFIRISVALPLLVLGAACELDVPDYNGLSLGDLINNPSKATIGSAATGIIVLSRSENRSTQVGYIETIGSMGRESHTLDISNPGTSNDRFRVIVTGRPGTVWSQAYRSMRQQKIVLQAVDAATDMTPAEKEGVRGFVKTMQAHDFLCVINLFELGAIIDIKEDPNSDYPAIAGKAAVFARIVQLLDEAKVHLRAAGPGFSFPLGPGFTGFATPATFLRVNRGLRARVAVYLANMGQGIAADPTQYTTALTALSESFVDTTASASLTAGAYFPFSTNSGDVSNVYYDPVPRIIYSHPSDVTDAQPRLDASPDLRSTSKVAPFTPRLQITYPVDGRLKVYDSPSASIPIVRNEELVLLRAEANLGCVAGGTNAAPTTTCGGNAGNALSDVNYIRRVSGGLAPITVGAWTAMTDRRRLDALLYEKRFSLLFEGHRWLDLRRYNLLLTLPRSLPLDKIFPWFPLPDDECVPRNRAPAGCTPATGL
ncbi:MAG: RagB/SusD family nutrient uptake outer membrane protein [Gemmatimonadetes bacterium]|nr:RagB/SusD family nutrient uptake outer membrane protein [Gemmatimonadota bacterium]